MAATELPKGMRKALTDITGEVEFSMAIKATLEDAIAHRREEVTAGLEAFRDKYGMTFTEFEERWAEGSIQDKYSYDVERDYLDWEALITRKEKLEEASAWLE